MDSTYNDLNSLGIDSIELSTFDGLHQILLLLNLLLTKKKQSPENVASLLVRLTFLWMDRLIKTGFRRNIKPDDIWEIDKSESSENISNRLEIEWNKKANM